MWVEGKEGRKGGRTGTRYAKGLKPSQRYPFLFLLLSSPLGGDTVIIILVRGSTMHLCNCEKLSHIIPFRPTVERSSGSGSVVGIQARAKNVVNSQNAVRAEF